MLDMDRLLEAVILENGDITKACSTIFDQDAEEQPTINAPASEYPQEVTQDSSLDKPHTSFAQVDAAARCAEGCKVLMCHRYSRMAKVIGEAKPHIDYSNMQGVWTGPGVNADRFGWKSPGSVHWRGKWASRAWLEGRCIQSMGAVECEQNLINTDNEVPILPVWKLLCEQNRILILLQGHPF